jgi:hypothetical protein
MDSWGPMNRGKAVQPECPVTLGLGIVACITANQVPGAADQFLPLRTEYLISVILSQIWHLIAFDSRLLRDIV